MIHGQWATCAIAGTTSAVCNLGRVYEKVCVLLPTFTSDTCTVQGAMLAGGDYYNLYTYSPADGLVYLMQVAAGNGGYFCIFPIGGFQFIKFVVGDSITGTFYCRGVRS